MNTPSKPPPKPRKKSAKKKMSPKDRQVQRQQAQQKRDVRAVLGATGFVRRGTAAEKNFEFGGFGSDFDDVFINENVVVLVEYTVAEDVGSHLKKKAHLYKTILADKSRFVEWLKGPPLCVTGTTLDDYDNSQVSVVVLYCSRSRVKADHKSAFDFLIYLDHQVLHYFRALTRTIHQSAQPEMLDFLGIEATDFGDLAKTKSSGTRNFPGSVLPETHSNYPEGFKVVSLYMAPAALLERAYVLRRDGWREGGAIYQRLLIKAKIDALRKYLLRDKRVFVNNIVVTLPEDTKILDGDGDTISTKDITETISANIALPSRFNSVGIVDGQHRLLSYHAGGLEDLEVDKLRGQQNLLVTGIVYPKTMSDPQKERFEANLFLEINANQSNAQTALKQSILRVLDPFADASIALAVLDGLNGSGHMEDLFQRFPHETKLLKTATVVSYGLKPLVKVGGPLFQRWSSGVKKQMVEESNDVALNKYVRFCVGHLNVFLGVARCELGSDRWAVRSPKGGGILNTTLINGLLGAFRQGLEGGLEDEEHVYSARLEGLAEFDFSKYKSSQYTRMSTDLAGQFLVSPN